MKISIVVPNLNGAKFLVDALDSIANQNYSDIEVLVSDGGSIDNSINIAKTHKVKVRWLRSGPDRGMYDAINRAMRCASGDVLAYLNSDDRYFPGALRSINQAFEQDADVGFIYGDLNFIDEAGRRLYEVRYPYLPPSMFRAMPFSPVGQPASFWRRRLYGDLGGFDESFVMAGDHDFFVRAALIGRYYKLDAVLAEFRLHRESMTVNQQRRSRAEIARIHAAMRARDGNLRFHLYQAAAVVRFRWMNRQRYLRAAFAPR